MPSRKIKVIALMPDVGLTKRQVRKLTHAMQVCANQSRPEALRNAELVLEFVIEGPDGFGVSRAAR